MKVKTHVFTLRAFIWDWNYALFCKILKMWLYSLVCKINNQQGDKQNMQSQIVFKIFPCIYMVGGESRSMEGGGVMVHPIGRSLIAKCTLDLSYLVHLRCSWAFLVHLHWRLSERYSQDLDKSGCKLAHYNVLIWLALKPSARAARGLWQSIFQIYRGFCLLWGQEIKSK